MGFSRELIDTYAPGADCIMPMKVWKLPDGKENMFPEVCNSGNYFAQLKKDGYWYQFEKTANGTHLFSRTVSKKTGLLSDKIDSVPHINSALATLPEGTILIGEIYYPNGTSKNVTRIMGCLAPEAIKRQSTEGEIHYYIHDIIKYKGVDLCGIGAFHRYQVLQRVWEVHQLSNFSFLELAVAITDNIQEATAEALSNNEEGMVLKRKAAAYTPDKRPAWDTIKIKKMDFLDVVCMGFIDATINYTGKELENWPYWWDPDLNRRYEIGRYYKEYCTEEVCMFYIPVTKGHYYGWKTAIRIGAYDSNGNLKEIGTIASGLTDELREDFAKNPEKYLGLVCSVQCMEKDSKEQTLRHAFFKGFRPDKEKKDCLLSEIF